MLRWPWCGEPGQPVPAPSPAATHPDDRPKHTGTGARCTVRPYCRANCCSFLRLWHQQALARRDCGGRTMAEVAGWPHDALLPSRVAGVTKPSCSIGGAELLRLQKHWAGVARHVRLGGCRLGIALHPSYGCLQLQAARSERWRPAYRRRGPRPSCRRSGSPGQHSWQRHWQQWACPCGEQRGGTCRRLAQRPHAFAPPSSPTT